MRSHRAAIAVLATLVVLASCAGSQPLAVGSDPAVTPPQQAFLDTLEQRTFAFFWERTDARTGLTPDRWPTPSFSSIAAVGFALTAYPIGVERGYVTRAAAAQRTLTTLKFFWQAPHGPAASGMTGYQGFFYHFLDMSNGHRFKDVELSTVDTSLLLAGVLFCQSYFDGANPDETSIRAYADSLYQNADWNWASPRAPLIGMGWTPEQGFGTYDWRGYDEAMLVYILALGSRTHPIAPEGWNAWTSTYQWGSFHGLDQVGFAPLFGHQFSHIWIDFRGIQDEYMRGHGIDYFENSRRATLSQHDYAIENPMGWQAYGDSLWGLSASDGPSDSTLMIDGRPRQFFTYAARGAAQTEVRDDGTIAPTALGGSLPFAPSITLATLISMRHRYGDALFSTYGFFDALNPSFPASSPPAMGRMYPGLGWVDTDYLGLDQGPIIAMAENYRTGLIWRYMRKNPNIIRGLQRAGFQGGWLTQAGVTP